MQFKITNLSIQFLFRIKQNNITLSMNTTKAVQTSMMFKMEQHGLEAPHTNYKNSIFLAIKVMSTGCFRKMFMGKVLQELLQNILMIGMKRVLIIQSYDDRYATSYKADFNQPDSRKKQFINTAESLLCKAEKQKLINEELQKEYMKQPKDISQVPPIDRIPVVGYKGHRPVLRQPLKKVEPPTGPKQIKLKDREVLENMLEKGNLDEKQYQKRAKQEPIVGYIGFLKGVNSENQYGQVYQNLALNSLRL